MSVGSICAREVVVATPDETAAGAALRMAEHDVGTLVIVDSEASPLGIVTDRDIVVRCVARGLDPATSRLGELMSKPAVTVRESTSIEAALERMGGVHTRRVVVVDDDDHLAGILALDDFLDLVLEEADSVHQILTRRH